MGGGSVTGPRGPRRLIPLCRDGDRLSRAAHSAVHFTLDRRSQAWPSRPQAAFPRAPAARNARKGRTCAAPARGVEIAAPRRGKAAGRSRRPGLAAVGSEGRRAATPGGECAGSPPKAEPAPQAWRSLGGGRSAADRAGGADGPTAPTCGGRAAPEHLRRNRRGGGAMQGRANGPPRRGLALHCGGVPPRNGWRPTWPGRAEGAALAATCPRLRQQAGRAAPRRRPGWAG